MPEFFSDPQHAWIAAASVVGCFLVFVIVIGVIFVIHDRRAMTRAASIEAAVARVHEFHARVAKQYERVERESKERDEALGVRVSRLEGRRGAA